MTGIKRPSHSAVLQGMLPIDRSLLTADLVAGVTMAALAIPEVIGYTKIAGTPVVTGLYTMLLPMVLYALFGSSRHLVVGADSATAAILAGGIAGMAVPGSPQWLSLAGALALLAGVFLLAARLIRLGFLADFLSHTVLIGFLTGVGVQIAIGEISGMLGLPGEGKGTVEKLVADLQQFPHASKAVTALSAGVLIILTGCRLLSRRIPGALLVIAAAIVATWTLGLQNYGIATIGPIPGGLPGITIPEAARHWTLIRQLAPTAFAMFVVILAQSAATSRAYANRHGERFDENVDLVGLCLANLAAGLSGSFVVNGSPTKTQMVASAGGKSQLAQLAACVMVVVVLLFFTAPLAYLPTAVLSTVVFLIGVELIDLEGMRRIHRERPWEFWVALITAAAVILVGVEQSILLAIVLSLVVHTRHGYQMSNKVLVPDEGKGWRQEKVAKPQPILPGLMIYRFMHNMYYANAQLLTDEVTRLVRRAEPRLAWLCIDASAVDDVDFTAAAALRGLHGIASAEGTKLVFCEVIPEVADEFDRSGLTDLFGADAFFSSISGVLTAYSREAGSAWIFPENGTET